MKKDENPLLEGQREKAGAKTFDKYSYQYHWALYRVLSNHSSEREYAVFVELHEDVVVADSLEATKAKFEFNQVKTSKTTFTPHQLVFKKKNGSSVLGKLLDSCINKDYSDKITEINLVALNAFSLELKKKNIELEKISISDLSDNQLKELEDELKVELKTSSIPVNINFIVPSLSEKNYQNDVISTISKLITTLHPEAHYNSVEIYRLLIDEINKKGVVTYDYTKWDELLQKKALTSEKVTYVINQFTNLKDEGKIHSEFYNICSEMKLKSIPSKLLQRSFDRYRIQRISNSSTNQIDITKAIVQSVENSISKGIEDIEELIIESKELLDESINKKFHSDNELTAAIICEYIMLN
jgi:hypothetical protein